MRDRLRRWGSAPLIVPRWMLTVKYVLFGVLGIVAGAAGIPTLSLTTWDGYTTLWGTALTIVATIAAVASARPRWEPWERWAALVLTALLTAYTWGAFVLTADGDPRRGGLAVVLVIVTLLPAVRASALLVRTGAPHD